MQNDLSLVNQGNVVAKPFNLIHLVCREDNRRAAIFEFLDHRNQQISIYWVETAERLVENKQGRLMQNRCDELHLLLHALREFLDFS